MSACSLNQYGHNRYMTAISFMLLSSVFVALSSLLGKQLVLALALPVAMLLRFLLPALVLWWVALITSIPRLNRRHVFALTIRSMLGVLSQYSLFYYLMHGSILDATLLFMTSPLFVPLILRATQKTPIQTKQWVSMMIGFIGVAFILKPTHNILDWHAIVGLASGLFNAGSQVYTHRLVKQMDVKSATLYIYTFSAFFVLIPALIFWHPLMSAVSSFAMHANSSLILVLIGLALVTITNKIFRGKAYCRVNKASSLTPFLYMAIIFAGLLDWVVYNIVPDALSIMGAALIMVSGFILYLKRSKV